MTKSFAATAALKQVCVTIIDFSLVERDRNVPSIGL